MRQIGITGFLWMSAFAAAQNVTFDYDRSASFDTYKTYRWVDSKPGPATDQLMDQNIKRAVDAQLMAKGFERVESGGDLQITYRVSVDEEKQLDGFGMGPRWNVMGRVTTSTIQTGKLILQMFDPARNQLVWRGAVEKTLDLSKDPDRNYRNLQKATAKLLKNYPPSAGK